MVTNEDGFGLPPANPRGQVRSSMFLAAVLRAGAEQVPVKIRNMSPSGALIESPLTTPAGTTIELMRGSLTARGTVIWSSANRCGVRFSSEVSVKDWLAAPSKVQQQRVDEIVALVKAGGTGLGREEDVVCELRSDEQLVSDLKAVVRLIQELEDELAASDETVARHGTKLQNLDIAMQMLRAVASQLTRDGSGGTMCIASLDDLRIACAQALSTDAR